MKRDKSIVGLVLVSIFFLFGTFTLYHNLSPYFAEVNEAYRNKDACNLDQNLTLPELANLFLSHEYVKDTTDARFLARWILERRHKGGNFSNLGALNLNVNRIKAQNIADSCGSYLQERLAMSRNKLGFVDSAAWQPATITEGQPVVKVIVSRKDPTKGWRGIVNKILDRDEVPVAGVPVRLTEHIAPQKNEFDAAPTNILPVDTVVAWGMTDESGVALLPVQEGRYYSVIPIQDGFEFGREKGTVKGAINAQVTEYAFNCKEHTITPFDANTYNRIKEDRALTVRSPEQWKDCLVMAVIIFLLSWWIGFFLTMNIDKKMGVRSDYLLLISLMVMTAICTLSMFAIVDPLVDRMLGLDMAWGVMYGVLALVAMSAINYARFFVSQSRVQAGVLKFDFIAQGLRWLVMPFMDKLQSIKHKRQQNPLKQILMNVGYYLGLIASVLLLPIEGLWWIVRKIGKILSVLFSKMGLNLSSISWPEGIGYIIMAMLLVVLLIFFGTGPEGSDARVNLGPLQPSEISKYLVVVFMAAFFATNADRIRAYATDIDNLGLKLKFQLRTIVIMVVCLGILLISYLLISDMGPGLVLIVTFIFIYSIARGDFPQLVLGVMTFILTLMLARWVNNTSMTMTMFAMLWFAAWLLFGWLKGKRIYESAVIMNLFFLIFMQAGSWLTSLGKESAGMRLTGRIASAWSGVWNNEVPGGDQVAQGLWSLATGGLGGQGLGKGNASLVPAFHTDMVFLSIGEVMGWFTLVLILVCLVLIIHRSLLLARRSGHPFLFYLTAGIAIVTGVQFFVIVLGSTGLIPLTGVAVPFLSYGKSSLIMNMAAFGIVISCSRRHATVNQKKTIRQYDDVVASSSLTFITMSVLLACTLFYYQFVQRDSTLIRPAYVCDQQGNRYAEYNPRITLLLNRLNAGNIYDRNGVLLATSDPNQLREQMNQFELCGLDPNRILEMSHNKMRRYYPFAEDLLFMLGDFNTRVLWGSDDSDPYGYLAEKRHLAHLRGFDNLKFDDKVIKDVVTSSRYVYDRFLPAEKLRVDKVITRYNYSALLPMLKSGIKSNKVKKWNEKREQRDLTLTIDANLQHLMQEQMASFIQNDPALSQNSRVRASVVVLDVNTGDLLTSSCYPLPDQDLIAQATGWYNDNAKDFQAFTDRDLGMTYQTQPGSTAKVMSALAGFMKLGDMASNSHYYVYEKEQVHKGIDPIGEVSIHDAIVQSSNNFFVHFVNDQDLHEELDSIYRMTGIRVNINGRHSFTPYYFDLDPTFDFAGEMDYLRNRSVTRYTQYMSKRNKQLESFNWNETGHAWGQHNIFATPLNMARVVSIIANHGNFVPTRFVLQYGTGKKAEQTHPAPAVNMVGNTNYLYGYMQDESDKHRSNYALPGTRGNVMRMGGKTGTPERYLKGFGNKNDAWYICFINSNKQHGPLAIAVRLERSFKGSGKAVQFVANAVVPALNAAGYELQ